MGELREERLSMGDVLVTTWYVCLLVTTSHSCQGHSNLALPARISNPVLVCVSS